MRRTLVSTRRKVLYHVRVRAATSDGRKRERVRAGVLRAELVHRDHGAGRRARAADLRSRRRRLRDRRRPRRADRPRARSRGAAGRWRCWRPIASPGTRPAATTASCCRASPRSMDRIVSRVGLRPRQGAVGALRDGAQICAHHHRRGAHAGRSPDRRLAQGVEGRQRRRGAGRPSQLYRRGARRRDRGLADRARARGAQEQPLFPRHASAARLSHPSAQLRARARGRGGSGGSAHLRGYAGAVDRRRRRAQAHRHAVGTRARRPYRARLQRPSRRAGAAHRRHADADLELCDRRPRRSGRASPRRSPIAAPSPIPISPTTTTASSAATGCSGPGTRPPGRPTRGGS